MKDGRPSNQMVMEPVIVNNGEECQFEVSSLTYPFRLVVGSRLDLVSQTVERVLQAVRKIPGIEPYLEEVGLVLDEALTNSIIHGNRQNHYKEVEIRGGCENDQDLLLVITDEGEGFDPKTIPDPTLGENIFASHGRGVYLIRQLMDQAQYCKGGRQLVLRKRLAQTP